MTTTVVVVLYAADTGTWTVPSDFVSLNSIDCIGAGQAGFDGVNGAAAPGALGGSGGSWARNTTASLAANQVLPVQIGTGGASNGALGGDTWVKTAGGTIFVRAKGGGSASTNLGGSTNVGGSSPARTSSGIYAIGRGGGGGGGAGGPDGPGGNGGDLNAYVENSGGTAHNTDNGCGGGGANGGQDGGGTWSIGTPQFHDPLYITYYLGNDKRTADTYLTPQVIPGDGGDSGPGMYTYVYPSTNGPNNGWCFSFGGIGVYGYGGMGAKGFFIAARYCAPDVGVACLGFQSDLRRTIGAWNGTVVGGGAGRLLIWEGDVPGGIGPGGGGGGNGYGQPLSAGAGANYGGGGGGGANSDPAYVGGPGADGLLRISYESGTPVPPTTVSTIAAGYYIERMDNRIWPNIESAWCLDCALAYPMPTPAGTLQASSATGDKSIQSYTIINGGADYTAPTGQIIDIGGPGTGATVLLVVSGGVIIAAMPDATGSGYLHPQMTIFDETGAGAVIQPIPTNYVTLESSTASFSTSNIGDIVRMGGGRLEIISMTSSTTTTVTANLLSPITKVITDDPDSMPVPAEAGDWSMTTPTSSVRGLDHLEGLTVAALADGGVVNDLVVTNGGVTLPVAASQILVGLKFTAQLQTLNMESPGGNTIQTRRKDVPQVVLRVDASRAPEIGINQPDAAAQPNQADVPWAAMTQIKDREPANFAGTPIPLYSGDLDITNIFTTWPTENVQIAVQQTQPVPLTVTALVPWIKVGDNPS